MKKLLTILAACFLTNAASASTNGLTEILGTPKYQFTEVQLSGGATRLSSIAYTAPSGDYRGMFVVFQYEANGNSADYPTSMFYGTQQMTQAAYSEVSETNNGVTKFLNTAIFFINESGISNAGTNPTINVSYFYTASQTKPNASYAFTIFTADEVLQTNPITYCAAFQTGGNNGTTDSITCIGTGQFKAGDLYLAVGAIGKATNGPLHSNTGTTALVNQVSNTMFTGTFYRTLQQDTAFKPYMVTGGKNSGRFILLASEIHNMGNPNNNPGNPLPIKLVSFTGKSDALGNVLNWTTSTEMNVNNYEVQRSTDGKAFNSLGMVFTKSEGGNSTTSQQYSFNDRAPISKAYYRLKIVDNDGSVTYSPIIVIDNSIVTASEMVVYPNPGNGLFTVSGVENTDKSPIKVMNSMGQSVGYNVISKEVAGQKTTVQLLNAMPGFYYVTYEANGKVLSSKVFVQ